MKKLLLMVFLLTGVVFAETELKEQKAPKGRYAIVLLAGNETNESKARAVHALLFATEMAEKGFEVVLIFDGPGTGWANELRKPENELHKHYLKVKELGMVEEICDYCADSLNVKEDLPEQQRKLLVGDYKGHPSLVKWIDRGYQVIVL